MPELPDVETYRRFLGSTAQDRQIRKVRVMDSQVLTGVSQSRLNKRLMRHRINETHRHGKHLMVRVGTGQWLAVHFGMTGDLAFFDKSNGRPEYTQVIFDLSGNHHLAYVAPRKLGEIQLVDDPETFIDDAGLGPDVLADLDPGRFAGLLMNRRGSIKSALMNQTITAGIGNVYSDEILYRARIHPATDVNALGEDDLVKLYRHVSSVLETAIENEAVPHEMPDSWLLRRREDGADCGICDGTIVKKKFSGRGAYMCNKHQRKE